MNQVTPAIAAVHLDPAFLDSLSPEEQALLPYFAEFWLRPEQVIPAYPWKYYGFICGRGFGKSTAICEDINKRVYEGRLHSLALCAPNDDRVDEVQHAMLIETSPPWFKAERYNGNLRWPNGVTSISFTPMAPGRPRSANLQLSWLCEIVDWQHTSRKEFFDNITTATRVGRNPQVLWDTTSKGKNEIILELLALNKADPYRYPIQRGTIFDNPMLARDYLVTEVKKYVKGSRRYNEELLGHVYEESAGAAYENAWIEDRRVPTLPPDIVQRLVAIDPGLSTLPTSDPTGFVVGSLASTGHVYVDVDLSERVRAEEWGDRAVRECVDLGAAGVIIETNHLGEHAAFTIRSRAANRKVAVEVIPRADKGKPFPRRKPGTIYVREVYAAQSKMTRAEGPSSEAEAGRVHIVGKLPELELELTTYDGTGPSPNRFDAFNYLVAELRGLKETEPPKDPVKDLAGAQRMHDALRHARRGARAGLGL